MEQEKDKAERVAGYGCLFGVIAGIGFALATILSGDLKDPRALLLLIPLVALFCWSIPMTLFSSDRSLRIGTGCICYPVLGLVSIVSLFDAESRSVAWWGFGFIGLLVLIGSIAGAVRKKQ
ncbi:MAG: hypothetical protein ACI4UV_02000 [Victivallales bacterium]